MRIASDPPDDQRGPITELLRLQGEFQARLADETLRYLRRIQGAFAPAAPGTVVVPNGDGELRVTGSPGGRVALRLEAENRQRVHCLVTPMLTPLVERAGTTWFPAADLSPASTLLAPGEVGVVAVELNLPAELPAGTYKGALVLQGFRQGGVPVTVEVGAAGRLRRARKTRVPRGRRGRRR